MEFSPTGLFAVYELFEQIKYPNGQTREEYTFFREPVTSFDQEGHALICSRTTGTLVRAKIAGVTDFVMEGGADRERELFFYWIKPAHDLNEFDRGTG